MHSVQSRDFSSIRQQRLAAKENMHLSVPTLLCYVLSTVHWLYRLQPA
jgi:hypothetical protein